MARLLPAVLLLKLRVHNSIHRLHRFNEISQLYPGLAYDFKIRGDLCNLWLNPSIKLLRFLPKGFHLIK